MFTAKLLAELIKIDGFILSSTIFCPEQLFRNKLLNRSSGSKHCDSAIHPGFPGHHNGHGRGGTSCTHAEDCRMEEKVTLNEEGIILLQILVG
jgi:hypothetical protein